MNVCTVPRRDDAPLLRGQFDDSVSDLFPERIALPWRGSRALPRQYSDSRLGTNNRPCFPNPLRVFLPGWRGRRVGKRMDVKGQSRPRHARNFNFTQEIRLALQSMNQLGLSNSTQRSGEYYREQWSFYYAERRRLLARIVWLAVWLGIGFLLFIAVAGKHSTLAYILAVPLTILLIALPAQWFIIVWRMRSWTCPQCGENFFTSALVNNPFGRRCRHCGLVSPNKSEIAHLHYEEGSASPR